MKLSPIRRRSRGAARGAGRRRNKIPDHPLALRRPDSRGVAIAAHRSSPQTSRVVEDAGHGRGREEIRLLIHRAGRRKRRRRLQLPSPRRLGTPTVRVPRLGGLHLRGLGAEGGRAIRRPLLETRLKRRLRGPISRAADRERKARFRRVL
jgi:hypothetical protein